MLNTLVTRHAFIALAWFHYQDLLMYSTFKPEVEEIIMEDKLPSCINSWDTFVNNNHPLQTEEDAEPLWKDAEPNSQRRTQSPSERTQSPWEDAEPPARTQSQLSKGHRALSNLQRRTQSPLKSSRSNVFMQ